MKKKETSCRIQTIGEEIANSISHGVGALLGIAAMVLLLVKGEGGLALTAAALYGSFMIILYLCSCLYHALARTKARTVFRIFDHCSIFLLILGSYLPISLVLIGGWKGWTLFGINAACTILGITFNSIDLHRWDKLSQILYLVMGWSVVAAIGSVIRAVPPSAFIYLVGGGLAYTLGIIFYKKGKKIHYLHFVWHLFVLTGSVLHFFFFYFYCY